MLRLKKYELANVISYMCYLEDAEETLKFLYKCGIISKRVRDEFISDGLCRNTMIFVRTPAYTLEHCFDTCDHNSPLFVFSIWYGRMMETIKLMDKFEIITKRRDLYPIIATGWENKKITEFKDLFTLEKKYTKKQFITWFWMRGEEINELKKLE